MAKVFDRDDRSDAGPPATSSGADQPKRRLRRVLVWVLVSILVPIGVGVATGSLASGGLFKFRTWLEDNIVVHEPTSVLFKYFDAVSRADYRAAWKLLGVREQAHYQGSPDLFAEEQERDGLRYWISGSLERQSDKASMRFHIHGFVTRHVWQGCRVWDEDIEVSRTGSFVPFRGRWTIDDEHVVQIGQGNGGTDAGGAAVPGESQCKNEDYLKAALSADRSDKSDAPHPGSLPDEWGGSGWTAQDLQGARTGLEHLDVSPEEIAASSVAVATNTDQPGPAATVDISPDPSAQAWVSANYVPGQTQLTYTFARPVRILRVRFVNGPGRNGSYNWSNTGRIARADLVINRGEAGERTLADVPFVDSPDLYTLDCDLGMVHTLSLVVGWAYPPDHPVVPPNSHSTDLPITPAQSIQSVGLSQIYFWGALPPIVWKLPNPRPLDQQRVWLVRQPAPHASGSPVRTTRNILGECLQGHDELAEFERNTGETASGSGPSG